MTVINHLHLQPPISLPCMFLEWGRKCTFQRNPTQAQGEEGNSEPKSPMPTCVWSGFYSNVEVEFPFEAVKTNYNLTFLIGGSQKCQMESTLNHKDKNFNILATYCQTWLPWGIPLSLQGVRLTHEVSELQSSWWHFENQICLYFQQTVPVCYKKATGRLQTISKAAPTHYGLAKMFYLKWKRNRNLFHTGSQQQYSDFWIIA